MHAESRAPVNRADRSCRALIALAIGVLAGPTPVVAQTWSNPASGDWFTPGNWVPASVPSAGGNVVISNGGTATLTAPPGITPLLSSLSIGRAGIGTGTGSVISNGVDIRAGQLGIGFGVGTGNGQLQISGAGGTATSVLIASAFSVATPSSLTGRLDASGNFLLSPSGTFVVGQSFSSARGTVTNGAATIGGNAGAASFFVVGDVFSSAEADIGSRSAGVVNIGGNLGVSVQANIGSTFDARVADAGAVGGFRFNQASGDVTISGTLSVTAPNVGLNIGSAGGGVADGSLKVGVLDIPAAQAVTMNLGNAFGRGGQATGILAAASGDLYVKNNIEIGVASDSRAQGVLSLGGQFIGTNNGALSVGTIRSAGTALAQAQGTVDAAGGLAGFSSYNVGTISGSQALGSAVQASVTGGAAAPASATGSVFVGVVVTGQAGGATSATGALSLGNTLNVNNGFVTVGQNFLAARGSVASGTLNVGGNAGTASFFTVGDVFAASDADVGSRSTGIVSIDGNLAFTTTANVGTAFNNRVADPLAAGGFRFDRASGDVRIGGTLSIAGPNGALNVGLTLGGDVDGSLRVGNLDMGANTLGTAFVGSEFRDGRANGTLEIGGGLLRTNSLNLGTSSGGAATGTLRLTHTDLAAQDVIAGTGGGSARLFLSDSQATVAQDMTLLRGQLNLERSVLAVGDSLVLGGDVLTHIDIDGLLRGTEFGAIDARTALLDGLIEIDFGDLVFSGSSAEFDIVRSGGLNGIDGGFDNVSFINLLSGYAATAGIEQINGQEVFRVRLARTDVPEPSSVVMALLGLALLRRLSQPRAERPVRA